MESKGGDAGGGRERVLSGTKCALLPFREEFAEDIARAANNPNVARNLLDHFPYPYSVQDAHNWITFCRENENGRRFCICVWLQKSEESEQREGRWKAIGGIDAKESDIGNFAHSVELGYWLAEEYWGRGIMSDALSTFISYLFSDEFARGWNRGQPIVRVWASVFERNGASARVLEKAGLTLEGRLRKAYLKKGCYLDALLYALVRDPPHHGESEEL